MLKSLKPEQQELSGFSCSSNWLEMDSRRGGSLNSFSTHRKVIVAQLQQSHHKLTYVKKTLKKCTAGEVVNCCTAVLHAIYK